MRVLHERHALAPALDTLALQDGQILVTEDDAGLDLLRECLCEAGFRVTAAATVAALAVIVAQCFDLILGDASMSLVRLSAIRGLR
jgi:CheY-like chemotaxis protein